MTTTRPLEEGQFEIGSLIFGRGTDYPVSSFEVSSPEAIAGDYQGPQSDEIRFTQDYLTPGTVTIELGIINNKLIANVANPQNVQYLPAGFTPGRTLKEALTKEWKADEIRGIWGAVKPLRYRSEGETRLFYGRPRKIMTNGFSRKSEFFNGVMDYQRIDTRTYADRLDGAFMTGPFGSVKAMVVERFSGDADTWMDIFITGPCTNPAIVIGNISITTNLTLAAGKVLALSSVPWERKMVNSDGVNLAANLLTPYLDEIKLPRGPQQLAFLAGGTTAATTIVVQWRDAFHDH